MFNILYRPTTDTLWHLCRAQNVCSARQSLDTFITLEKNQSAHDSSLDSDSSAPRRC
jgi:hypothetical protein